jgi:hypothetical protein
MSNKKPVSDSDTNNVTAAAEATAPTNRKPLRNEAKSFVYIGPALLGGKLKSNTVIRGTYAEITEYYKEVIAECPNVAKLIVPVARLADSREKAQKSGNVLYQYCQEIAAAITAEGGESDV